MFAPCQLRPHSWLHAVVLYNKTRASHTTFLLLIIDVRHTNNFSKTDLPTVTQDACDRVKIQPATEEVKYHFSPEVLQLFHWPPGKKSVYPLTFKSLWLMLHSYNCSAFFFKKEFIEQARWLHVEQTRLLCATYPVEHWSAALWKDSPIHNFTNLRIHLLIFYPTMSISVNQNIII